MPRKHIIITGTGRAGTTFLIQLFTALRLDTGFADITTDIAANCNAGMELDIRRPDAPYIIKSPWLCDTLDEVLASGEIIIEHAFVPVRDLFSAAESRRHVNVNTDPAGTATTDVPGGLWHTSLPEQQEQALTLQLYKLIHTVAKRNLPLTLLDFPRITKDPEYLYGKIAFMLGDISFDQFRPIFDQVAQPRLVHDFKAQPRPDETAPNSGQIEQAGAMRSTEKTIDLLNQQRADLQRSLTERERQIVSLKETLNSAFQERDELNQQRADLERSLAERDRELAGLNQALSAHALKIDLLNQTVESALQWQRRSWLKRAFHIWRPPGVERANSGFYGRLGKSFLKRFGFLRA